MFGVAQVGWASDPVDDPPRPQESVDASPSASSSSTSSPTSTYEERVQRAKTLRKAKQPAARFPLARPFVTICTSTTRELCSDVSLGDCSYLNTCHRNECRYVHWIIEDPINAPASRVEERNGGAEAPESQPDNPLPPQWINADLRELDVTVLGKYDVVVADPPWAIHQELPYGTLTDDEMMRMPVGAMQDEGGLLFLWVTGRAMELGRECLKAWGLPSWFNKGLDTQVLLAEVRQTSRKPDELYDIIERIVGGRAKGRKVELFGRTHNLRPGWWTLGNQLGDRDQVFEPEVVANFARRYPEKRQPLLDPKTLAPVPLV
ncbi:hypothetical protein Rhopal_006721-T1 [Rhodotorula paludigena]|uniref:mRNA m(6)A methyltransferase n=1 Tax=Rhodotorula paludigena TaxID=86838 RepID=A0AAV5GWV7_9BASI|nr:hypothetical protein Rhopal_006721-T1 [Rhodotorula paludigena]